MRYTNYSRNYIQDCPKRQRHVHEILGSTEVAGKCPHSHRFATVSGEALYTGGCGHVHDVKFRTDFFDDHFHEFCGRTSGPIRIGNRHIHFLKSVTTFDDGHKHCFKVATLIEDPSGENSYR